MKCQIQFPRKNKNKYYKMSSAEIKGKNLLFKFYGTVITLNIETEKPGEQCRPKSDTTKCSI